MRRTYQPLPLSDATYAHIARVAAALCGRHRDRDLAEAVTRLSHVYTRDRARMQALDADGGALLARIGFFFARDLPKVFGPLDELARCGTMPQRASLRVLDVGAGLGATSFGLARWLRLRALPTRSLEVVALEQSKPALRAFEALARGLAELPDELAPIALDARCGDLRSTRREGRFDLVLFGFVLNELFPELAEPERIVRRAELLLEASAQLEAGGALIVLEPALKESARALMALRDHLVARGAAPYVIAPCLHAQACPMLPSERDWCHQELPYALPPALAGIARAAGLRYEGLSYASLVLANQPRPALAGGAHRIVSDRLESKGKLELFSCSQRGYQRLARLTRDASDRNLPFGEARRGDILHIEGAATRVGKDTRVTRES